VLLKFGKAKHGFADGVHANASISQVAAGWKCSLSFGIYGTKGSVRWDLQQPNEIIVGRRDEPNQILQRGTPASSKTSPTSPTTPAATPKASATATRCTTAPSMSTSPAARKTPALFATAEDGHHEVKLCEAILKSSKAKTWVKV
jgi:predicted dehydrogenase